MSGEIAQPDRSAGVLPTGDEAERSDR